MVSTICGEDVRSCYTLTSSSLLVHIKMVFNLSKPARNYESECLMAVCMNLCDIMLLWFYLVTWWWVFLFCFVFVSLKFLLIFVFVFCVFSLSTDGPISTEHCDWLYGIFGHETSCTRYWTCWNGTATEQLCIGGLLYNENAHSCDWPENVDGCQKHRKYYTFLFEIFLFFCGFFFIFFLCFGS